MPDVEPKIIDTPQDLDRYDDIISLKDRHVLASAISSKASFLITLDRKHFFTEEIKNADLSIEIMTPGEFLEIIKKNRGL